MLTVANSEEQDEGLWGRVKSFHLTHSKITKKFYKAYAYKIFN